MDILGRLTIPVLDAMGMPMSIGDLLGFVTGVLCVWLTARANIWNFPVGIANSVILGLVFYEQRLFADASLQLVFIALSVQGWGQWLSGQHATENAPVFRTSARRVVALAVASVLLTGAWWNALVWLRGSAPLLDAMITALSLCAQYLLNCRALATWYWWILVDLISIPLYWSRGLPLISLLYVIFLLLCVKGWANWRHKLVAAAVETAA